MSHEIDASAEATTIGSLELHALSLRRHILRMAERVGQGYVGQGLGIADLLLARDQSYFLGKFFGSLAYRRNDCAGAHASPNSRKNATVGSVHLCDRKGCENDQWS